MARSTLFPIILGATKRVRVAVGEEVMKAVLALIVIYVGTFLVAIQGASQSSAVQAAPQKSAVVQSGPPATAVDPEKEADIRSLMELVGARDMVQDGITSSTEQYREKLLATVPNNEKGQAFVNAFANAYQEKVDVDQLTEQLLLVYDQHFTHEEIKGLLQFYGSPLGQKVAAEMPKIGREIQARSRAAGTKAAKEALQALKEQNPEVGQSARLGIQQGRLRQRSLSQQQVQNQAPPDRR
jgi:uncharacterized protein